MRKSFRKSVTVVKEKTMAQYDDIEFEELANLEKLKEVKEIKGLTKGTSYYRLFFHCRDLKTEFLDRCDPMVVLFIKRPDNMYCEIGRTESIVNDSNPSFSKSILVNRVVIEELTKSVGFFGTELTKTLRFVVCSAPKTKYLEVKPELMDFSTLIGTAVSFFYLNFRIGLSVNSQTLQR
jgi:hypothetical protein